jgi:ABC-type nitrate/sulfonate/bicarbonate transport system substrate-binding protein
MLRTLATAACLLLLASYPAAALDQVSLQLKWKHQFQFAGYYAALERGYYRDAGLDVEIREGGPDVDAMKAVEGGKADFGVCTTSILLEKLKAPRLVNWPLSRRTVAVPTGQCVAQARFPSRA